MNKYLIAALGAGTMLTIASPAMAQNVTGTVNITGSVANKCSVQPGSGGTFTDSRDLLELAKADGTLEASATLSSRFGLAGGTAPTFKVVCNTAAPTVAVDATELTTGGAAASGYASRIDYTARVSVVLTAGGPQVFTNSSTAGPGAPAATTARIANSAANVTITADTFATASATDLLVAGAYTGNIKVDIAPGV